MNATSHGATVPAAKQSTVLAFDFGTRAIGVAVGNTVVCVANPLATIREEANAPRFAAIGALIAEWTPDRLIVGRPYAEDGSTSEMTARSDRFANQLEGRFRLPVERIDERYTTRAAASALTAAGVRGRQRAAALDEAAAQVMLQAWLDADESDRRSP